jgi:hypothetical protein
MNGHVHAALGHASISLPPACDAPTLPTATEPMGAHQ